MKTRIIPVRARKIINDNTPIIANVLLGRFISLSAHGNGWKLC